jgi:alpha-glucuronidase
VFPSACNEWEHKHTEGIKMKDQKLEKVMDVLLDLVQDNCPDCSCSTCPLVKALRDLRDRISANNYRKVMEELEQQLEVSCGSTKSKFFMESRNQK